MAFGSLAYAALDDVGPPRTIDAGGAPSIGAAIALNVGLLLVTFESCREPTQPSGRRRLGAMRTSESTTRKVLRGIILAAALSLVVMGVVMADSHKPIAIEPDAALPKGTQVATFALG